MLPKIDPEELTQLSLPPAIRSMSLSALLPPPPPLTIRKYEPSVLSQAWMAQVVWGVVYSRNEQLHDAHAVRLVQIMQLDD